MVSSFLLMLALRAEKRRWLRDTDKHWECHTREGRVINLLNTIQTNSFTKIIWYYMDTEINDSE